MRSKGKEYKKFDSWGCYSMWAASKFWHRESRKRTRRRIKADTYREIEEYEMDKKEYSNFSSY